MTLFDPIYIDSNHLSNEASRTLLLLDALRQRDHTRVMLKRLHPMVEKLREALEPLQAEYNRWATKHYSAERRVAEVRKRILQPHRSEPIREPKERIMTDAEAQSYLEKQSESGRAKLLMELKAIMKSGDE
jgi:DNA repair exonuclease SbcCD ATPase subunit